MTKVVVEAHGHIPLFAVVTVLGRMTVLGNGNLLKDGDLQGMGTVQGLLIVPEMVIVLERESILEIVTVLEMATILAKIPATFVYTSYLDKPRYWEAMEFWQNSTPFFGAAAICTKKFMILEVG